MGHAASQTLAGRSNYAVPSQIHEVDGVIDLTAEQVEGSKMPAASDGHLIAKGVNLIMSPFCVWKTFKAR